MLMKRKILALLAVQSAAISAFAAAQTTTTDISQTYQTLEHFGASDAWSAPFIGRWSDAERARAAKFLFARSFDASGNPEGIGLSIWRVNLGAGTLEQGEASKIKWAQRRAESFVGKDGKLDFSKCEGHRFFMEKAREYGCNNFILFSNSPLVQMTKNGLGFCDNGASSSNLRDDKYQAFADYLADVTKHFSDSGYNIYSVSPVNEPQVPWVEAKNQEGSLWNNSEIKRLVECLDKSLAARGLDTQISIAESGRMNWLVDSKEVIEYRKANGATVADPADAAGTQLETFFSPSSKYYVGDIPHVSKKFVTHGYTYDLTWEDIVRVRKPLNAITKRLGIGLQMSEWVAVPSRMDKVDMLDGGNFGEIDIALMMARLIYADFTMTDITSWQYWKALEMFNEGGRALVEGYKINDGTVEGGGVVRPTKILWGIGNYSLFIRPNFARVKIDGANEPFGVMATAWISPDKKRIVQVYVNLAKEARTIKPEFKQEIKPSKVAAFRTDSAADLANLHISNADSVVLAPRSITTLVLDL